MKSGQLIDFPLFTSRQYFPDQILIYWPGFLVDRGITWAAAKWPSEQFPSPPFSRSPLVPHDMHVQLDHFPKEVGVKIQKSECYTHPVRESPPKPALQGTGNPPFQVTWILWWTHHFWPKTNAPTPKRPGHQNCCASTWFRFRSWFLEVDFSKKFGINDDWLGWFFFHPSAKYATVKMVENLPPKSRGENVKKCEWKHHLSMTYT